MKMKPQQSFCLILLMAWLGLAQTIAAQRWSYYMISQNVNRVRYSSGTQTYWFGTADNGLWRFDGQREEHLPLPDIRENTVNALAIDEKNKIVWVGGFGFGLFAFDIMSSTWIPDYWHMNRPQCPFLTRAGFRVTALFADTSGTIWFGIEQAGIVRKDSTGWLRYKVDMVDASQRCTKWDSSTACWVAVPCQDPLPGTHPGLNSIDCITQDEAGNLYFGTRGAGLLMRDRQEKWTLIDAILPASKRDIQALAIDHLGNKWLGTTQGVCKLNASNDYADCNTGNLVNINVKAIWIESYQHGPKRYGEIIWFGTAGGVSVLDSTGRWESYQNQDGGLASDDIRDVIGDGDGSIWFGGLNKGGVSKLNRNWSELTLKDSLSSNFTWAVEKDDAGRLWVGTDTHGSETNGRIEILEKGTWRRVELYEATCSERPRARDFVGHRNDMWVATTGCGLIRVSQDSMTQSQRITYRINTSTHAGRFPGNDVYALALREGKLWAGTTGGLVRIDIRDQSPFIDLQPVLPNNYVNALAHDQHGRLWVGTAGGLFYNEGQAWQQVEVSPFAPFASIEAIAFDAKEQMWIGTLHGIARFDSSSGWTSYSMPDLPDNNINAIGVAPDGMTVWCGTVNGVAVFINERWTPLTSNDGLSGNLVYQIAFGPAEVTWFATWGGGIARYRRAQVRPNTYLVNAFNIVTAPNVALHFSGYDYNTPIENLRYQYALDHEQALENAPLTLATSVTLPALSEGKHTFFVRAVDKDGNVDLSPAKLRFHKIEPRRGGTAVLSDSTTLKHGSIQLYVPPTVLPDGSSIILKPVTVDTSAIAAQGGRLRFTGIAFALVLQPENVALASGRPLTLTVFYGDTIAQQFNEQKLAIFRFERGWQRHGGTVESKRRTITTTMTQLDTFALFTHEGVGNANAHSADLSALAAQPRILSSQFAETVTISFHLGRPAAVTVKVYNPAGRLVKTLCENQEMPQGQNALEWDGFDRTGSRSSGMYVVCVQAHGQTQTKTVMVTNQ